MGNRGIVTDKELQIDKYSLDEMIVSQSELYYRAGEQYIRLVSKRDSAKEKLEVVQAQASATIRAENSASGTKMTESAIAEQVLLTPDVQEALRTYAEIKAEAEQAWILKEAFQQRAYALRDLVSLFNASYFMASHERENTDKLKEGRRNLSQKITRLPYE